MGKSDEYQFGYLDDNVRFADQVNGAFMAKVKIPRADDNVTEGESGMDNGEKTYDVCKAWADWRLEGVEEGKLEGKHEQVIQLVCKKLQKNKSVEVIAEELEEEIAVIERIIAVQKKVGTYDAGQIREALAEA